MKKWPEIIFALLCLILCASLSLGMLVFGPAEAAANERLASKPKLIQKEKWNPDYLTDGCTMPPPWGITAARTASETGNWPPLSIIWP